MCMCKHCQRSRISEILKLHGSVSMQTFVLPCALSDVQVLITHPINFYPKKHFLCLSATSLIFLLFTTVQITFFVLLLWRIAVTATSVCFQRTDIMCGGVVASGPQLAASCDLIISHNKYKAGSQIPTPYSALTSILWCVLKINEWRIEYRYRLTFVLNGKTLLLFGFFCIVLSLGM